MVTPRAIIVTLIDSIVAGTGTQDDINQVELAAQDPGTFSFICSWYEILRPEIHRDEHHDNANVQILREALWKGERRASIGTHLPEVQSTYGPPGFLRTSMIKQLAWNSTEHSKASSAEDQLIALVTDLDRVGDKRTLAVLTPMLRNGLMRVQSGDAVVNQGLRRIFRGVIINMLRDQITVLRRHAEEQMEQDQRDVVNLLITALTEVAKDMHVPTSDGAADDNHLPSSSPTAIASSSPNAALTDATDETEAAPEATESQSSIAALPTTKRRPSTAVPDGQPEPKRGKKERKITDFFGAK